MNFFTKNFILLFESGMPISKQINNKGESKKNVFLLIMTETDTRGSQDRRRGLVRFQQLPSLPAQGGIGE